VFSFSVDDRFDQDMGCKLHAGTLVWQRQANCLPRDAFFRRSEKRAGAFREIQRISA
jgi:hypothetical protein